MDESPGGCLDAHRVITVTVITGQAYDGDAMALYLLLDNQLIAHFEPLVPSRNIPSMNAPYEISGATKQQAPQTLTMYNWLYGGSSEFNTVAN